MSVPWYRTVCRIRSQTKQSISWSKQGGVKYHEPDPLVTGGTENLVRLILRDVRIVTKIRYSLLLSAFRTPPLHATSDGCRLIHRRVGEGVLVSPLGTSRLD